MFLFNVLFIDTCDKWLNFGFIQAYLEFIEIRFILKFSRFYSRYILNNYFFFFFF